MTRDILKKIIGRDVYAHNEETADTILNNPKISAQQKNVRKALRSISQPSESEALVNRQGVEITVKTPEQAALARRGQELDARKLSLAESRQALAEKEFMLKRGSGMRTEPSTEKNVTLYRKGDKSLTITGVPTLYGVRKGLSDFATPLTQNLASTAGGALIGQFEDPAASKQQRMAVLSQRAYLEYLKKKYAKQGQTVNSLGDVMAFGTDAERKRVMQLQSALETTQRQIAQTGFLSGGYAPSMARQSAPRNLQLKEFTQVGTGGSYGAYGPETLGRLGIGQGLRAHGPENKFVALGIGLADTDTIRIANILGKAPNPAGESPGDKIKRFTPDISKQSPREKLRQFI